MTWVVLLAAVLVGKALPVPEAMKPTPVKTLKDLQKKLLREHPSWHFVYVFDEENKVTGFWIVTNDAYARICNQMRVPDYLENLAETEEGIALVREDSLGFRISGDPVMIGIINQPLSQATAPPLK